MIKLLIIDALNVLRRLYSALPAQEGSPPDIAQFLANCDRVFKQIVAQHAATHAVCVFEQYDSTWRHALYPPYKANRKPQPEAMLANFDQVKQLLKKHGIYALQIDGYEADDIIASIVQKTRQHDCQNLILSTDSLMAQLLDAHTQLYDQFKQAPIDAAYILDRYAVTPDQLADYFALVGSSSVNVPGIEGIGAKTASRLLSDANSIDALLADTQDEDKTLQKLRGQPEALYLYRALFQLRLDCPMNGNLNKWRLT